MSPILTQHRREQNIRRLLEAPDDLMLSGAPLAGSAVPQPGAPPHRELFATYLDQLRPHVERVASDWQEAMTYQTVRLGSPEAARDFLTQEYPAGPAADMHFIAVVRKFWLACDALNDGGAESVDPPIFLLAWVIEAGENLCVEVLASQPYWPVGLSKEGRWC
ncbi:hypothetical protein FJ959_22970 [Mesorhizobium sp. B2-2-4]|uniref:hypothetical protein n=1 Tax=unclassified Mesorhizobium TaxID=325217 RepID=UPI001125F38A|nr:MULTISPECIES: hypothetical protein [unclassified Mesorhizobium]MBZ9961174.1 hypothetical protein [Mesorhizobium sp. BR1-1-14]TPJ53029.1 hypothetical protein FJ426_14290 [Mesorhizobium sp. B2-6-4]TPL50599.1 hypothetical protein FJ942_23430 [Mesorhizobium sp. B2-4-2]TPM52257.1 hypothetical protein FJ959_22970 [Mesorhizobium sp. B2-2-4]TPM61430.1 hypothetical protein FJ965_23430 [Mesorhizobium sp. B2-2-1]